MSVARRSPILVNGSLAYDELFLYSGRIREHLPSERGAPLSLNLRAQGPERALGGCGGNVAYTLCLLQAGVHVHGWLGRDGEAYLRHLRRLGADTSGIQVVSDLDTSRAVLLADSAGDQILFFGDPPRPVRMQVPDLTPYALAVVTAGVPAYSLEFLEACREKALPVVVDPGKFIMDVPPDRLREALAGADSLVVNQYEHRLLLERTGMTPAGLSARVSAVVVTRGREGLTVLAEGAEERIPSVALEEVVDPNGAGDAFLAGYVFGRHRGSSPAGSARIGATAASFALQVRGAQNHSFTIDEFQERLTQAYGKPETALEAGCDE